VKKYFSPKQYGSEISVFIGVNTKIINKFEGRRPMKRTSLIFAVFAFCILFSGSVLGQKCTLDDSSMVATFAGVNGQPPYSITSDGAGPYSTLKGRGTTSQVMFQICNGSYDFTIDLTSSSRTVKVLLQGGTAPSSFLNFDRVASVPVTVDSNDFATFCGGRNGDGSIILDTPNTTTADNYAGCGEDSDGYYFVRRNVVLQLTSGRSLRFQDSPYDGGTLGAGTSYIKVYHPTSSTWTLSVENTPAAVNPICGTNGSCAAQIYQPNHGPAYVQFGTLGRFEISLTSSRVYP